MSTLEKLQNIVKFSVIIVCQILMRLFANCTMKNTTMQAHKHNFMIIMIHLSTPVFLCLSACMSVGWVWRISRFNGDRQSLVVSLLFSLAPVSEQETLRPIMPTAGISDGQGLVIEAIVTFNLVLVALSVTTPGKHSTLASLTIGCCKGSGILAAVRQTQ